MSTFIRRLLLSVCMHALSENYKFHFFNKQLVAEGFLLFLKCFLVKWNFYFLLGKDIFTHDYFIGVGGKMSMHHVGTLIQGYIFYLDCRWYLVIKTCYIYLVDQPITVSHSLCKCMCRRLQQPADSVVCRLQMSPDSMW